MANVPDSLFLCNEANYSVAWPTKLALAPMLADHFIASLQNQHIDTSIGQVHALQDSLGRPEIAVPAWDQNI